MAREKPRLVLIAAVARNGVIGNANRLLWHLAEDARHFRAQTMGCPVIMGRRTWESLPERFRPLPGRTNIVVTRRTGWTATGAVVAHGLDDALAAATAAASDSAASAAAATSTAAVSAGAAGAESAAAALRLYVIGGVALYAAALPRADELELTEIDADFDGDTRFPDWPRSDFVETLRERHHAAPPNDFDFSFVTYRRRR